MTTRPPYVQTTSSGMFIFISHFYSRLLILFGMAEPFHGYLSLCCLFTFDWHIRRLSSWVTHEHQHIPQPVFHLFPTTGLYTFIFLGFFLRRHYDSLTLHPIGMDVLRISSSPSPFHSYQSGCGLCRTCMDFIIPYNGDLMGFSGQRYLSMCHTWTITVASETDRPYAPNVQYENVFYRLTLNCTIGRYSGKPCCHVHASGRVLNRVPAGKSFMNSTFRK